MAYNVDTSLHARIVCTPLKRYSSRQIGVLQASIHKRFSWRYWALTPPSPGGRGRISTGNRPPRWSRVGETLVEGRPTTTSRSRNTHAGGGGGNGGGGSGGGTGGLGSGSGG